MFLFPSIFIYPSGFLPILPKTHFNGHPFHRPLCRDINVLAHSSALQGKQTDLSARDGGTRHLVQ